MSESEKKNRIIGLAVSTGVHLVILLVMFFLVAFNIPNPPFGTPADGVVLNLGDFDEGSGDVQSETLAPVSDNPTPDNTEAPQQQVQQQEEVKPVEAKQEEAKEIVSKDDESGVVVKEKEDKKKEIKPEPIKGKAPEKEKTSEVRKEEVKEVKGDVKGTADGGKTNASQGNDVNKKGDKGKPEGTLDPNGQYTGKQGGGGSGGLDLVGMGGWGWADKPVIPELPDNVDGRIVFEIECDEDGEIIGITTLERGLSPRAEQLLKEQIRKNSLIRVSAGQVPERSKGRVVFVLKTK